MRLSHALLIAAVSFGALRPATAAPTTPITFAPGSLIIPSGSAFQDDCGVTGAYGLVYQVLRANKWLQTNGKTPITIHWVYSPTKGSPNRCAPSNIHTPPAPSGDARWNDGCDFTITNSTVEPAKEINNASPTVGNDTVITTMVGTNVSPAYASKVLSKANGTTTVQYLGGPFVIDSADAANFLGLLSGAAGYTGVVDPNGVAVDFSPYRTGGNCAFGSASQELYVHIHRASASFTANDSATIAVMPPRLALVDSGTGISAGILPQYLQNAGLAFAGASGTATGITGTIYDSFSDNDIQAGRLNNLDAGGNPKYRSVWTPHWDLGTGLTAAQQAQVNAIASFVGVNGHGVVGECASIGLYEGAIENGSPKHDSTNNAHFQTCLESTSGSGICAAAQPGGMYGLEKNTTSVSNYIPNCSDPDRTNGQSCAYFPNPGSPMVQIGDWEWFVHSGSITSFRPNQVNQSGQKTIYRPGVAGMIGTVPSVNIATFATTPLAQVDDWVGSYGPQFGDTSKGDVYYLGGHTYDTYVPGTRVVLNTLFALNVKSPVSYEVSRASPIVATVNTSQTAIVQGTFQTPTAAASSITTLASVGTWTFPYITGHMRARLASTITTSATAFSAGTIIFDAFGNIPTVTSGGCSAKNGTCRRVFTNTNTVPTNGVTFHPTVTPLDDTQTAVIGPLIVPNATLAGISSGTYYQTILRTILNGALGGVDRSTVAVIPPSTVAGLGSRPTMAYFGGLDGMLHAVCATTGGTTPTQTTVCPGLGKELWAFLPRSQLALLPTNTQRIDGSVRVIDAFGDFTNATANGTRSWHTILTFQTGYIGVSKAASYAIDVTDPASPVVLWEYVTPATPAASDLGAGLTVAAGQALMNGTLTNVAVLATNNGGTGGTGVFATAVQLETGNKLWATNFGYPYPTPPRTVATDLPLPVTGIVGGAVGVDLTASGYLTDVVFGDLYGDIWRLNIVDGTSRNGTNTPLFSFSTNKHPFGAPPAIYASAVNPTTQYAAFVSGGYDDPAATSWSTNTQYVIAVKLNSTAATVTEATAACTTCALTINTPITAGDKGYAQPLVVGTQLFVTTDSGDINSATYGTTATSGHLMTFDLSTGTSSTVVIASGAGSITNSGTTLYGSSSTQQVQLGTGATSTVGQSVDSASAPRISRNLWLRTQ